MLEDFDQEILERSITDQIVYSKKVGRKMFAFSRILISIKKLKNTYLLSLLLSFVFLKMTRLTLKKEERLTNKKTFELLFDTGKSFTTSPFRLRWIEIESDSAFPVQLGISVPKRSFPKATDRNMLKRRIRESYRRNKHTLYEKLKNKHVYIALMIIYIAKSKLSYEEIERKMILSLQKIIT